MNGKRFLAGSTVLVVGALVLSACAGGGADGAGDSDGNVSMTFWHNSTTGDGKKYWDDTVAAFDFGARFEARIATRKRSYSSSNVLAVLPGTDTPLPRVM